MLTDNQIRNAKPSARPRKLFDSRGLYLHLMPGGGRYWRFNYQFNGRNKTLAMGIYPDVTLASARNRLLEARKRLAEGADPAVAKEEAAAKTFEVGKRPVMACIPER